MSHRPPETDHATVASLLVYPPLGQEGEIEELMKQVEGVDPVEPVEPVEPKEPDSKKTKNPYAKTVKAKSKTSKAKSKPKSEAKKKRPAPTEDAFAEYLTQDGTMSSPTGDQYKIHFSMQKNRNDLCTLKKKDGAGRRQILQIVVKEDRVS